VQLDTDVDAYIMYEEFKKFGELIGIYVFTLYKKYHLFYHLPFSYLLLYAQPISIDQQNIVIRLKSGDQVNGVMKQPEKPIDIQRPYLNQTLHDQLQALRDDRLGTP
jgi:hypothetical protein